MLPRHALRLVLLIGLVAALAAPGRALLPDRTLLPLDLLHQGLLPWANDVSTPKFNDHYKIDAVQEYLPLYQFVVESLRRGEFPTWNPFNRGGTAYLDNPVPVPFHPLKLLLSFLSPEQTYDLIAMVHFLLAFVAMALYARSLGLGATAVLFGALCWTFSSFFVFNFVHERMIGGLGLLPLGLMLLERLYARPSARTAAPFGLTLGLGFLISDPTAILVYLLVFSARIAGYWLFESARIERRRLGWLLASGLLAFAVAAPTLLSTIQGLATNVRVFNYEDSYNLKSGVGTVVGGYFGLLLSAIHPYALGSRESLDLLKLFGQTLTLTPFVGSFTLLFALFAAPRVWREARLRWLLLVLGMGLVLLLPPITQVWSTRNVILLTFVIATGGALGMHRLCTDTPENLRGAARLVVLFAALAWIAYLLREAVLVLYGEQIILFLRQGIESRLPGYLFERYPQWNIERADRFFALQRLQSPANLLFIGGLTVIAAGWYRLARAGSSAARAMVVTTALASSVLFALDNIHVVDTRRFPVPEKPDYLDLTGRDPGPPRVAIPRAGPDDRLLLPALLPQFFGLAQVGGYGSLYPLGPQMLTRDLPLSHPVFAVLGVNYVLTPRESLATFPAYARKVHTGAINIFARDPLSSRFHITRKLRPAASRTDALAQARADVRPVAERDFYLTELPTGVFDSPDNLSHELRILRDEATRIEVLVTIDRAALLVIGSAYYPGWRATVDARAARIYCVDGSLQGVWLSPGRHMLLLEYVHWPSRIGVGLQLLALLALAYGIFRHVRHSLTNSVSGEV